MFKDLTIAQASEIKTPKNVRIRLDFTLPRDKVTREIEKNEMVTEVSCAIRKWYYETYSLGL